MRQLTIDFRQNRHTQNLTNFEFLAISWKRVHFVNFGAFFYTSKLSVTLENLEYYTTQFQFFLLSNNVIQVIS